MDNNSFMDEAKSFKNQMGFCMVILWVFTIAFGYFKPDNSDVWGLTMFGAIIFTGLYSNMKQMIRESENKTKD